MASSKTHPHIEMASLDELTRLIDAKRPEVRELYLEGHRLVLDAVPDIHYSVDVEDAEITYGPRQFGYDGWGMAALAPYREWTSLALVRGSLLEDPAGILEGTSRLTRHVKLRSLAELAEKRDAIRALLQAARRVNAG